eukprot:m.96285 g.96285  ORF g.96285 m.96285 type:complete len:71 (+) comp13071_c0_seq3:152-364(+)
MSYTGVHKGHLIEKHTHTTNHSNTPLPIPQQTHNEYDGSVATLSYVCLLVLSFICHVAVSLLDFDVRLLR